MAFARKKQRGGRKPRAIEGLEALSCTSWPPSLRRARRPLPPEPSTECSLSEKSWKNPQVGELDGVCLCGPVKRRNETNERTRERVRRTGGALFRHLPIFGASIAQSGPPLIRRCRELNRASSSAIWEFEASLLCAGRFTPLVGRLELFLRRA